MEMRNQKESRDKKGDIGIINARLMYHWNGSVHAGLGMRGNPSFWALL